MPRHPSVSELLPLHPMELQILLAAWEGPTYGTRVVESLEAAGTAPPYPANLFRRIRDLLTKGVLEEAAPPEGADPRRTYVRLTEFGRALARAEVHRLQALVDQARFHRVLGDV